MHVQENTLTGPGGDAFRSCIQLQVKADNCSNDHQSPDQHLQQVTQPRPQPGVYTQQSEWRERKDRFVLGKIHL